MKKFGDYTEIGEAYQKFFDNLYTELGKAVKGIPALKKVKLTKSINGIKIESEKGEIILIIKYSTHKSKSIKEIIDEARKAYDAVKKNRNRKTTNVGDQGINWDQQKGDKNGKTYTGD